MAGIDRETGQPIGRQEHIQQSIRVLLTTPHGSRVMARAVGIDYLDDDGRPLAGLAPARVEAAVHDALERAEPRIRPSTITAHFDDGALTSVRVQYRDVEDKSEHEVIVAYRA